MRQYPSPYVGMGNNPVSGVDVTGGGFVNPIYDIETGNLLGTDDRGLQGEAILMNKECFTQGMSHEQALNSGFLLNNNAPVSLSTYWDVKNHSYNLKTRPDWDGVLTLDEANKWYRKGNGQPLFVDAAKINLSPIKKSNFGKVGSSLYKNFVFTTNTETGLVYGTIKLTLLDPNGAIKLGGSKGLLDVYDFDYKKGQYARNIATWIGVQKAGEGTGYNIFNYGTGKVK